MIVEVDGIESEFLMEEENTRSRSTSRERTELVNNNATVVTDKPGDKDSKLGKAERKKSLKERSPASPRAQRFREMVAHASAASASDNEEPKAGTTSNDEGEIESNDGYDTASTSSSVKIMPRKPEDIEREEAEYQEAANKIVDQAVDRTMEKLTEFMKNSGVVFAHSEDSRQNDNERRTGQGRASKGKKGKQHNVNDILEKIDIRDNHLR